MKRGFFLSFRFKEFLLGLCAVILCVFCVCLLDFNYLMTVSSTSAKAPQTKIIIDPGHGEFDGGTQSESGIIEKDINLEISLKLRDTLKLMGFDVIMTRDDDTVLSDNSATTIRKKKNTDLKNRLKIINNNPESIFISIHQNYFTESKYNGTQVFYSKNNPESKLIAQQIQKSISDTLQTQNSRQIKQSGSEIFLLNQAQSPSVMVECGFLSNEKEAQLLTDDVYQQKLVLSISNGLCSYLKANER